ncbi:MAG: magnesium and cobalt transport protein CorA, partial [Actinomycetia bacterium]|nr:magnesium and cobalt transport protein CorA [Actinomycetes bacterium]
MSDLQSPEAAAGTTAEEPAPSERRMPPNTCTVIHDQGSEEMHFSRENVEKLLAGDSFFWVDVDQPNEADHAILRDVFKFHPLAVEDSEKFGQRAKLDDYDGFVFIVVYGAVPDEDRLVEVHCFYSEKFLVTVHRDEAPAFTEVRERYVKRNRPVEKPGRLLYRIIDALVDSFFPILADFDDRIDELENQTFLNAGDAQLQEIFQMKRLLVGMRKAITPQRDMFASVAADVTAQLPG